MSEQPEQRPEGRLIADALARTKMSGRAAAARAGLSDGRWRQIVSGYQSVGGGNYFPVIGPADTIARMADVVGVTAEQLAEAGREDAAGELISLRRTRAEERPVGTGTDPVDLADLTPEEVEAVKAVIRAMRSGRQD